jgi:hypothetical protein
MLDNVQQSSTAYTKIKEKYAKLPKIEPELATDFSKDDKLSKAWAYMANFATQCEISVDDLLDYADRKYRGEHVLHICRGFTEPSITEDMPTFWEHYCLIKNVDLPKIDLYDTFVSCSC